MKKALLIAFVFLLLPALSSAEPTKEKKVEYIQAACKKAKELDPYWTGLSQNPVHLANVQKSIDAFDKWFADLKLAHFEPRTQKEHLYEDARMSLYKTINAYKTYLEGTYKAWNDVREETIDRNNLIIESAQRELQTAKVWLDRAGSQIAEADSLP